MDKTRLETLQEVTDMGIGQWESVLVPKNVALEAMKIFGRQCFDAGRKRVHGDFNMKVVVAYKDADEYFKELEGTKNE